MKTKVKRLSKRTLAVFLGVIMLTTCIFVGQVSTVNATTWPHAWNDASGCTIYYDNSITRWTNVYFKIGRNWNYGDSDKTGYSIISMSKVSGTDYIYKATISYSHFTDFLFVNASSSYTSYSSNKSDSGWVENHDEKYTAFTSPKSFALGSSTFFFIGQSATVGSTASPNEVACYGAAGGSGATTSGDYTTYEKKVTNKSVSHGTVTVAYKDDSGTDKTISEGSNKTMLIGKKLTVTEVADTNYLAGDITVTYAGNAASVTLSSGGSTFTSGNNDTDVTGSFSFNKVTYTGLSAVAKGSTDGTSYTTSIQTINSSFSADNETGISLTAPDLESSNWRFVTWVTSGSGTFSNATNRTTTFTPSAHNEVATAQYKKIYSLSASVDNTGYTSGCSVSVNKATALAGEGYTVTITPGTDNAEFESLKINSTDVTSDVSSNSYSGTASGANSDINIVAKFTDNGWELRYGTNSGAYLPASSQSFTATSTAGVYTADLNMNSSTTYFIMVASNGAGKTSGIFYEATNNQDTFSNGSYTLTKYGVENNNYANRAGNIKFKPSNSGKYRFTFNRSTRVLTVAEATYTASAVAKGTNDGTNYDQSLQTILSSTAVGNFTGRSITAPTIEGYQFVGWDVSNCTVASDSAATTTMYPTANGAVATAKYKKVYSITVSHNGHGTISTSNATRLAGESYTITVASEGRPYKFTRLELNNTDVTSSVSDGEYTANATGANGTLAFEATFTDKATYTATFGTNRDGVTVSATADGTSISTGATIYDGEKIVFSKTSTPSGYRFKGWYSNSAGTGTALGTSSTYMVNSANANLTVYAIYVKTYTVTYHKYGPLDPTTITVGSKSATNNVALTFDAGSTIQLNTSVPAAAKFMGWFSNGEDLEGSLLSTNTSYTLTNNLNSDMHVYAYYGYNEYFLGGSLRGSNYGDNTFVNDTGSWNTYFQFQANNAEKPWEYTLTYDRLGSQYMIVVMSDGTTKKMYNTLGTSASETESGALGNITNYDKTTSNKWKLDNLEYSKLTLTWNALTQRLSWTEDSVDYADDYTVILVDTDKSNYYTWSYGNGGDDQIGNDWPGAALANYPTVNIDGTDYKMILLKNSDFGAGDNYFTIKLSNNGSTALEQDGNEQGKINTIVCKNGSISRSDPVAISTGSITVSDSGTIGTEKTANATADASTQLKGVPVKITTHPSATHTASVTVTKAGGGSVTVTQNGNNFTFTMPDGNVTASVTYEEKELRTVTSRSNNSELGTISTDKDDDGAEADDTVTVTAVPGSTAKLSTVRVYKEGDQSTTITPVVDPSDDNVYTFTMPNYNVVVYGVFEEYSKAADFWYDGYQRQDNSSNAAKLVKQDATTGTGKQADIDNLRFTEVMYNGHKYAYRKVTRRDTDPDTGNNYQEFVVKSGESAVDGGGSGRFYVEVWHNNNPDWNGNVNVQFYSDTSGTSPIYSGYTSMSFVKNSSDNKSKIWKTKADVPSNAVAVRFQSNNGSKPTTALFTGANFSGGGIRIDGGGNQNSTFYQGTYDSLDTSDKYSGSGGSDTSATDGTIWYRNGGTDKHLDNKSYSYITDGSQAKYGNNMELGEFSYNSKSYPMHSQVVDPASYYVIILYPTEDYGILYPDSATSVGSNSGYRVFATRILPGEHDPIVNYYAKDGMIRDSDHKGSAEYATTSVTTSDYVTANVATNQYSNSNYITGTATKGHSITVSTQINDTYKSKYYVAGYSFNGVTPELLEPNNTGLYECTYDIPSDMKGSKLEITPIFFLQDSSNCVNFYVDGFSEDKVQPDWGDTLYIYPFYQYYQNGVSGTTTPLNGQAENYRAYPGQPVINYGGRRYTQIPLTDNGEAIGTSGSYRVKGVTINNGFFDYVHNNLFEEWGGFGDDNKDHHKQTYDYDDFYKIFNEYKNKGDKKLNSIYYTFKYKTDETKKHRTTYKTAAQNSNTASLYYTDDLNATINASTYSDAEFLTDTYGRKVDLFGTKLSSSQISSNEGNELLVISQGYENNNAGAYGTEWTVYHKVNGTYTKITGGGKTMIVPSALVIANADDVSDNDYPGLDGDKAVKDYKGIYQELEAYRGIPVKISYETSLEGGAKPKNTYDQAYRCDGRWTYTKTTDNITSNVKIEYKNEAQGVNDYTEDTFVDNSHVGTNTGVSAYFSYERADKNGYGATSDGKTTITSLVQDDKFYSLTAEKAGSYEFVGWYSKDSNGDYHVVNNADPKSLTAESAMSSASKFVARFKYVASGSLTISHQTVAGQSSRGTTYLGVYVGESKIADETSNTAAVTLDKTVINSNNDATITVKLRTVPTGENTFSAFTAKKSGDELDETSITSGQTFFGGSNSGSGTVTRTITFTVDQLYSSAIQQVNALKYYSELNKPTNKYNIKYTYKDRYGNDKSYSRVGTFTDEMMKAYVSGTAVGKTVDKALFEDLVPHESNFKKTITWNTDSATLKTDDGYTNGWKDTGSGSEYTFMATVSSTTTDSLDRHAVFNVPYNFDTAANRRAAIVEDGKVNKLANNGRKTFEVETIYGKWFDPTRKCTASTQVSDSQFVTAPATIYDGDTVYYFSYWKLSTLTSTGKEGKFVTNVYYSDFYYLAYENYYITAVYSANSGKAVSALASTNNGQGTQATISFLQDSRNQWNGNSTPSGANYVAGDVIYNDFALAFKHENSVLNNYTDNNVKVGIIIERLGLAEKDGDEHTGTLEGYEKKYASTVGTSANRIKAYLQHETYSEYQTFNITSNKSPLEGEENYKAANIAIASNYGTHGDEANANALYQLSDRTRIDNKNRAEFGYSLYNTCNQSDTSDLYGIGTTYTNKNYVYRAFSYIMVKDNGSWTATLSEEPAYFCMYDTAVKEK